MKRTDCGQSFVEYIILIGVILGAVMAFSGALKSNTDDIFKEAAEAVDVIADKVN